MKRLLVTLIVLLVAGNVHAGSLQDRLAGLLGMEPAPERAATIGPDTVAEAEAESKFTFWLLGTPTELDNQDAEISARLGWFTDDVEFGVQFDAVGIHGENDEAFGAYVLMHITGALESTYIGYAAGVSDQNRAFGPIVGTIIGGVAVEYRYRDFSGESPLGNATDRHQVFAGLPLRF